MEPVAGELERPGEDGSSLLTLPGSCPWEDEDEPLSLGGIKPKSSPIPRRRSSESFCSDDDSQPPLSSSRRVSFADAFGLSLVSVKQFDSWAVFDPSGPLERDLNKEKDHFLSLLFTLPQTREELLWRVREQKLELESLELLPGTTTLKGRIRVLNLCFDKLVFIHMSLDCWNSHFDLLAEYVPGLSDGDTDSFSFKLTLVPPFERQGARVDFCLRYDTPFGSFWANNNGQNYVLFCCEKAKEQDENEGKHKRKSCLKPTSLGSSSETSSSSSTEDIPEIILNCEVAVVTEPVQKEKMQEECLKLQEENSRNHNNRNKRRAERLAKVQQYFTQREEKDIQQTEINTGEATAMANVNEWTPTKGDLSSNFSTPEANEGREMKNTLTSLSAEPRKLEGQENTSSSVDTDSKHVPVVPIQMLDTVNIPVQHPELTTKRSQARLYSTDSVNHHKAMEGSVSQALGSSQDKETLTSQTVSVTQNLFSSDISNTKCLEKAWECFENGTVERIGKREDRRMMGKDTNISRGKASNEDDVVLENNPGIEPFGQTFTFETVVAPFYHQVFEKIETERRDLMNRSIQAKGPAGNLEDGSLRVVTYQSYPRAPHGEANPNVCMFEKHVVSDVYHGACKEPFPQDLLNTKNTTKKPLFDARFTNKLTAQREASHNIPLTDMTEDPCDANISELKILQKVIPTKKGHLKNRLPFQLECSPNSTLSWEEDTFLQTKQTPDTTILQNKHLLDNTSEDTEYSLDNMSVQSEYSSQNSQQDPNSFDCVALTAQHDLDSTTTKTSLSTVSENLQTVDGSNTQVSFETRFSTNVAKIENMEAIALTQTQSAEGTQILEGPMFNKNILPLQHSSKLLEESHIPIPHSALLPAHTSSHMMPGFSQCDATTLFQNLISEATIQTQNPRNTSLKTSQKSDGTTHVQNQITEGTNLTEQSDKIQCYTNDDLRHVCRDLESNNGRYDENDGCERKKTDTIFHSATENSQAEKLHINPEKTTAHVTLLNPQHISQIYENKEHSVLVSDFSYRMMDFNIPSGKAEATLMVSNNDNEEGSSTQKVTDIYKDNEQEENLDKSNEHKLTNMKDHRSIKLSEETQKETVIEDQEEEEEEKQEEEEQQKAQQEKYEAEEKHQQPEKCSEKKERERPYEEEQEQEQQKEHEENERQEIDENMQLCNEDKFENELHYIDDKEAKEEKMGNNTGRNTEGRENDDRLSLEVKTEEQKTVGTVRSVAIVESNTNDNSFENEICLNGRQEQLSEYRTLEWESEEPMGHRCSISAIEVISWKTDSSQQAPSQNCITTCSSRVKLLENNLDSIKLIDKEKELCCQIDKCQPAEATLSEADLLLPNEDLEKQERNSLNEQSEKDMDDGTSTESLTDDEMELYLHSLKNTQQSVFRDCMSKGNYSKRASISRTRTVPSPMPSISESMDEDQPIASLEDMMNEKMMQLESAALPLTDEEVDIEPSVVWWRGFFSSVNMLKMIGFTFLFVLFLLTAYHYDFIACFGLYILALYWLYFQVDSEHLKDK